MPCNTATVTAIDALRQEFEPHVPVIGTVPAVKPAAAGGTSVAVWATVRTTASDYQARLIADFANGKPVVRIACPGLAEAIDRGDPAAVSQAIADAAGRTPQHCDAVVLGCTHYPWWHGRFWSGCLPAPPCTTVRRRSPGRRCGVWTGPRSRTARRAEST